MAPTMTIAIMLAVTLGAALYVAWPLLFGSVRAEDYLSLEGFEPEQGRPYPARTSTRQAAQRVPERRTSASSAGVDLDVEQEIEAFRRNAKHAGATASITCASCGRPVKDPDAVFCSKCGAPVSGAQGQNRKKSGKSREDR